MSPFLFNIYIDDLIIDLANNVAFPITFADDLTASFCGKAHFYSNDKTIKEWSSTNDMEIQLRKCAVVFHYKHLGAVVNRKGSLTKHYKPTMVNMSEGEP